MFRRFALSGTVRPFFYWNKCNINCRFCYNYGELDCQPPIGEGMWEIGGTKFREEDVDLLLSIQKKPTGVSYVYLEPFMEIEKYYGIIRMTGDDCIAVADKVFTLNNGKSLAEIPDRKLMLGDLRDKQGRAIDSCCVIVSRVNLFGAFVCFLQIMFGRFTYP